MQTKITGKVALITGGAGGIGQALGREMARQGAAVTLADCDGPRAAAAAAKICEQGGRASSARLDVADPDAFRQLAEEIFKTRGRLDYLFNNAGIGITGEVRDMSLEAWNRILDINLRGVVHGIQAVYPLMIRQGSGHIANTACIAGLVPFPMTAAYCATKHAVVGLSAALRGEAASLGIGISVICPGTVDTGMFDAIEYIQVDKHAIVSRLGPGLMPADRCARAILRGVLRNRSIITIHLHARVAWWLYRLSPNGFLGLVTRTFKRVSAGLRIEPEI